MWAFKFKKSETDISMKITLSWYSWGNWHFFHIHKFYINIIGGHTLYPEHFTSQAYGQETETLVSPVLTTALLSLRESIKTLVAARPATHSQSFQSEFWGCMLLIGVPTFWGSLCNIIGGHNLYAEHFTS